MSETTNEATSKALNDEIKALKLSPHMIEALTYTPVDGKMAAGPTRGALMRRGLVKRGNDFGYLTEAGRELALKLRARP